MSFFPKFKTCSLCKSITNRTTRISNQLYFSCAQCGTKTFWSENTYLEKAKISITTIEKLVILFLDNRTVGEAHSVLHYHFVSEKININTVRHYFEIFCTIVYDTIQNDMNTTKWRLKKLGWSRIKKVVLLTVDQKIVTMVIWIKKKEDLQSLLFILYSREIQQI